MRPSYLSPSDRRAETEPAEERVVVLNLEGRTIEEHDDPNHVSRAKCAWCGRTVRSHSSDGRAACDAAYDAELNRRTAGPTRVSDVAGRSP